jgi:hypothetical protein
MAVLGHVCFSFLSPFFGFREIQKIDGPKSEKLMEMCFQLLTFRTIQFLDLPKANKNDEKLETTMPLVIMI